MLFDHHDRKALTIRGSLCDLRIARGGEAEERLHHLQTSLFWRRADDERHLGKNCL